MASREVYIYDTELKQWLPRDEVLARRPEKHNSYMGIHMYKAGFNHGLGGYCGSKGDEQSLCSKIEDRTGDRPQAIGDAKLTNHGTRTEY